MDATPGARHTGAPRALNALEFAAVRALEARKRLFPCPVRSI
jgi:hypothetical protein